MCKISENSKKKVFCFFVLVSRTTQFFEVGSIVAGSGRFMLVLFGCGQLLVNYLYSTPPSLLNLFYFVLSLFKSFLASPRFSAGIRVVVPHSRVFGVNPASISCLLRSTGKLCCLDYSVGDNWRPYREAFPSHGGKLGQEADVGRKITWAPDLDFDCRGVVETHHCATDFRCG